jgi:hypothetical protein
VTYPQGEDSHGKLWVILDNLPVLDKWEAMGVIPPGERLTQYQLVGEVTAHQGFDA